MQAEAIRFYCGIGEPTYNHHPVACGPYACVSPVCGRTDRAGVTEAARRNKVYVPTGARVIQDSGAFSDGPTHRLSYAEALERQIAHAHYYKYTAQVTHRASYDVLIDEAWQDHVRHKARWSEEAAQMAVEATVAAAAFLDAHRGSSIGCIMSVQGVTPAQYRECAVQVLRYVEPDRDMVGLGGWCILGKQPSLLPVFRETMQLVIPLLAQHGVTQVHLWGVCATAPLRELLALCDRYHLHLSTDSMGPSVRPMRGAWGYGSWRDGSYTKPVVRDSCRVRTVSGYHAPMCLPGTRCAGLERARHVQLTRDWLANFREREATSVLASVEQPHVREYGRTFQQLL